MKRLIFLCTTFLSVFLSKDVMGQRRLEVGANLSFSVKSEPADNFSAELFGGYNVSRNLWLGAGINYANYRWRTDLPVNLMSSYVQTNGYSVSRPYIYARYDILPDSKWCPFLAGKIGYGFFSNSQYRYLPIRNNDYPDYFYKYIDLRIRNGIFTSLDLGVSLRLGKSCKMMLALCADIQSVGFRYGMDADYSESKINFSMGPKIGFSFF